MAQLNRLRCIWFGRLWCTVMAIAMTVCLVAAPKPAWGAPNQDDEIVYLDPDGVIRVIDPVPPSPGLAVKWFSPSPGWRAFALGDVTGDGDLEIVAVKLEGSGGRLAVFDPVAVSGPRDTVSYLEGVPWRTLYDVSLPRPPVLVAFGDFDPNRSGPEILYSMDYSMDLPSGEGADVRDLQRFVILRQPVGQTDGTEWEVQLTWDTRNRWTWIATGNLDGGGPDEFVLVDEPAGTLSVYGIGDGVFRVWSNTNSRYRWRVAEFLQYIPGGPLELGAVRDANLPLASVWVFRYENGTFVDHEFGAHLPPPSFMFKADFAGNGDDEMVMLRAVPQEISSRPRLFIRDNGNDGVFLQTALLDGDNGYRVGAAGDTNGDGRDEIAIMRPNRIRLYTSPQVNANFVEYAVATDASNIRLGNLDAMGLDTTSRLGTLPARIERQLAPGATGAPIALGIWDVTKGTAAAVTLRVQNAPWAELSTTAATTPVTVTVTLDAAALGPGLYTGEVVIETTAAGFDNPTLVVPLVLRVESPVWVAPEQIAAIYHPCPAQPPLRSYGVSISGPPVPMRATVAEGVDWVSVTPDAGQVPLQLTVTIDPTRRTDGVEVTDLIISYDLPNVVGNEIIVPVILVCTDERHLLPFVGAD